MNGTELAGAARAQATSLDRGVLAGLAEPDIVLPAQFFESPAGTRAIEAEKQLMMAILADAIDCLRKYATADRSHGRRLYAEAVRWIFESDGAWVFSFESICAFLRLDASALRRALRQWNARAEMVPATRLRLRALQPRALPTQHIAAPRVRRRSSAQTARKRRR